MADISVVWNPAGKIKEARKLNSGVIEGDVVRFNLAHGNEILYQGPKEQSLTVVINGEDVLLRPSGFIEGDAEWRFPSRLTTIGVSRSRTYPVFFNGTRQLEVELRSYDSWKNKERNQRKKTTKQVAKRLDHGFQPAQRQVTDAVMAKFSEIIQHTDGYRMVIRGSGIRETLEWQRVKPDEAMKLAVTAEAGKNVYPAIADAISIYMNKHYDRVTENGLYLYIQDTPEMLMQLAGFDLFDRKLKAKEKTLFRKALFDGITAPAILPITDYARHATFFWQFFKTAGFENGQVILEITKGLFYGLVPKEDKQKILPFQGENSPKKGKGIVFGDLPYYANTRATFEENKEEIREKFGGQMFYTGHRWSDDFVRLYKRIILDSTSTGKKVYEYPGNLADLVERALIDCGGRHKKLYDIKRIEDYLNVYVFLSGKMAEKGMSAGHLKHFSLTEGKSSNGKYGGYRFVLGDHQKKIKAS